MKSVTIVVVLFLLPFSALAGTFLETFDHKGLGRILAGACPRE